MGSQGGAAGAGAPCLSRAFFLVSGAMAGAGACCLLQLQTFPDHAPIPNFPGDSDR